MAAELTPELLAQLEQDIASLTRHGEVRTSWAGNEVEAASGKLHVCDAPYKTACKLARLINAAPSLVAAAKERDQLRAERDLWVRDRDEAAAERDTARQLADKREQERDAAEAEIERLRGLGRGACDWLESTSDRRARLYHADHLRAEIERMP